MSDRNAVSVHAVARLLAFVLCVLMPAVAWAGPPVSIIFMDISESMDRPPDPSASGGPRVSEKRYVIVNKWAREQIAVDLRGGRHVLVIPFDTKAHTSQMFSAASAAQADTTLKNVESFLATQRRISGTAIWDTIAAEMRKGTLDVGGGGNSAIYIYTDGEDTSDTPEKVAVKRASVMRGLRERWNLSERAELGLYEIKFTSQYVVPPPYVLVKLVSTPVIQTSVGEININGREFQVDVEASFSASTDPGDTIAVPVEAFAGPVGPMAHLAPKLSITAQLDHPLTRGNPKGKLTVRLTGPLKTTVAHSYDLDFKFRFSSKVSGIDPKFREQTLAPVERVRVEVSPTIPRLERAIFEPGFLAVANGQSPTASLTIQGNADAAGSLATVTITMPSQASATITGLGSILSIEAGKQEEITVTLPLGGLPPIQIKLLTVSNGTGVVKATVRLPQQDPIEAELRIAVEEPVLTAGLVSSKSTKLVEEGAGAEAWQPLAVGPLLVSVQGLPKDASKLSVSLTTVGDSDVEVSMGPTQQKTLIVDAAKSPDVLLFARWKRDAKNRTKPRMPQIEVEVKAAIDFKMEKKQVVSLAGAVVTDPPQIWVSSNGVDSKSGVLTLPEKTEETQVSDSREVDVRWNFAAKGATLLVRPKPSEYLTAEPAVLVSGGGTLTLDKDGAITLGAGDTMTGRVKLPVKLSPLPVLDATARWTFSLENSAGVVVAAPYNTRPAPYTLSLIDQSPDANFMTPSRIGTLVLKGVGAQGEAAIKTEFSGLPEGLSVDVVLAIGDRLEHSVMIDPLEGTIQAPVMAVLRWTGKPLQARQALLDKPIQGSLIVPQQEGPLALRFKEPGPVRIPITVTPQGWKLAVVYNDKPCDQLPPMGAWNPVASPEHRTGKIDGAGGYNGEFRVRLVGPPGLKAPDSEFNIAIKSDSGSLVSNAMFLGSDGKTSSSVPASRLMGDGVGLVLQAGDHLSRANIGGSHASSEIEITSTDGEHFKSLKVIAEIPGRFTARQIILWVLGIIAGIVTVIGLIVFVMKRLANRPAALAGHSGQEPQSLFDSTSNQVDFAPVGGAVPPRAAAVPRKSTGTEADAPSSGSEPPPDSSPARDSDQLEDFDESDGRSGGSDGPRGSGGGVFS